MQGDGVVRGKDMRVVLVHGRNTRGWPPWRKTDKADRDLIAELGSYRIREMGRDPALGPGLSARDEHRVDRPSSSSSSRHWRQQRTRSLREVTCSKICAMCGGADGRQGSLATRASWPTCPACMQGIVSVARRPITQRRPSPSSGQVHPVLDRDETKSSAMSCRTSMGVRTERMTH